MSDEDTIAVASPPAAKSTSTPRRRRKKQSAETRPQPQLPYVVVLHNDAEHTFPHVIETLMKVFGYSREKSLSLTRQIHHDGRGVVWSGNREVAELKRDQIRSAGTDFYATTRVDFPLRVTVEPVPG